MGTVLDWAPGFSTKKGFNQDGPLISLGHEGAYPGSVTGSDLGVWKTP